MKIEGSYIINLSILFCFGIAIQAQTLADYINQAKKQHSSFSNIGTKVDQNSTTQLKLGYFINPQYTISGAQRAYIELNQEIPWLGKGNISRKWHKEAQKRSKLLELQELELLSFQVKEHYYKMYQYQKQKEIYVTWAENLRSYIANNKESDRVDFNSTLKYFEHQAKLIEVTEKLQIVDGFYQNEVIIFNDLLKSESLDEPKLPLLLAMPEEEIEFQFPDPYESASFLNYESEILQLKSSNASQHPWTPKISLGLRYSDVIPTNGIDFGFRTKDLIEPQVKIQWNLFSKKAPKISRELTDQLLDQKISALSRQLQTAINNQISARIAYDSIVERLKKVTAFEEQLEKNSLKIDSEKKLQIKSLKYTFEIQQIKAVTEYYISTSKMQLYF